MTHVNPNMTRHRQRCFFVPPLSCVTVWIPSFPQTHCQTAVFTGALSGLVWFHCALTDKVVQTAASQKHLGSTIRKKTSEARLLGWIIAQMPSGPPVRLDGRRRVYPPSNVATVTAPLSLSSCRHDAASTRKHARTHTYTRREQVWRKK